jgi:AraC-like DNA-binding protein
MTDLPPTIPLNQVVNFTTLFQASIFAAILALRPFNRTLPNLLLAAALLFLAATKGDQLYQALGGLNAFPHYGFFLAPLQALITPCLYLYVLARTDPEFRLERRHLWHLTPMAALLFYLFIVYYRLPLDGKIALVGSGGFSAPVHRFFVPLVADFVQIGYLAAAIRCIHAHGLRLEHWFSRVEDRDCRWLRRLVTIWAGVFALHAAWTAAVGIVGDLPAARGVMAVLNVAHLGFVNALMLMGVMSISPAAPRTSEAQTEIRKYSASSMSPEGRQELFERARRAMLADELHLTPDLSLREFADRIGVPPRDLSEAVNDIGDQTFFEFVNRARIDHAKKLLEAGPGLKIIDIAFQAGFNSKTAFNTSFKRYVGLTPGDYRRMHASSPVIARPVEKST